MPNLTGPHALIILAVIILLFGASKLPALAKSVGQSAKIFKNEIKSDPAETPVAVPVQPVQTTQQATTAQSVPTVHVESAPVADASDHVNPKP